MWRLDRALVTLHLDENVEAGLQVVWRYSPAPYRLRKHQASKPTAEGGKNAGAGAEEENH
jgi:hypothetical protein